CRMREVLMRPSGPPRGGLRSYNSGAGDNFEALRLERIDDPIHPDRVAGHMAGDHEVRLGALQLLQLPQVPLVDVHCQDGIDAVLIIRAIDGCATIRPGRHLDDPASDGFCASPSHSSGWTSEASISGMVLSSPISLPT